MVGCFETFISVIKKKDDLSFPHGTGQSQGLEDIVIKERVTRVSDKIVISSKQKLNFLISGSFTLAGCDVILEDNKTVYSFVQRPC